jgi:hypothetical protein
MSTLADGSPHHVAHEPPDGNASFDTCIDAANGLSSKRCWPSKLDGGSTWCWKTSPGYSLKSITLSAPIFYRSTN